MVYYGIFRSSQKEQFFYESKQIAHNWLQQTIRISLRKEQKRLSKCSELTRFKVNYLGTVNDLVGNKARIPHPGADLLCGIYVEFWMSRLEYIILGSYRFCSRIYKVSV